MSGSFCCCRRRDRRVSQPPGGRKRHWRIQVDPQLRVYAIWFNMYPGDSRQRWPDTLLTDARVRHYWDEGRGIGQLYLKLLPAMWSKRSPDTALYRRPTRCGMRTCCTRAMRTGAISRPRSSAGAHRYFARVKHWRAISSGSRNRDQTIAGERSAIHAHAVIEQGLPGNLGFEALRGDGGLHVQRGKSGIRSDQ